jgi:tRNA A37 methylthiotransferase MiaB
MQALEGEREGRDAERRWRRFAIKPFKYSMREDVKRLEMEDWIYTNLCEERVKRINRVKKESKKLRGRKKKKRLPKNI